MSRLGGARAAGALAVLVALAAAQAEAQPSEVREQARALFEQGRAHVEAGDCASAIPLFRQSQALYFARGTLLNLASCETRLGKVASAWQHLQELMAVTPPGDTRFAFARREAEALEPRVPRLRLELAAPAPRPVRVLLDGVEIAPSRIGAALPVDPGVRIVGVRWPGGGDAQIRVRLAERSRKVVRLDPPPAPPPAPRKAPAPRPRPAPAEAGAPAPAAGARPFWPAGLAAFVAASGAGAGVGLTLAAKQRGEEAQRVLDNAAEATPKGARVCEPGARSGACARISSLRGQQDTYQNLAVAGYVAGGVAALGAVGLLVWSLQDPGGEKDARIAPMLARRGGGLVLGASF